MKYRYSYVLHLFGKRLDRVVVVGMRIIWIMIIFFVDSGRGRSRRRRSRSRRRPESRR
jgi:hypothetical protein